MGLIAAAVGSVYFIRHHLYADYTIMIGPGQAVHHQAGGGRSVGRSVPRYLGLSTTMS